MESTDMTWSGDDLGTVTQPRQDVAETDAAVAKNFFRASEQWAWRLSLGKRRASSPEQRSAQRTSSEVQRREEEEAPAAASCPSQKFSDEEEQTAPSCEELPDDRLTNDVARQMQYRECFIVSSEPARRAMLRSASLSTLEEDPEAEEEATTAEIADSDPTEEPPCLQSEGPAATGWLLWAWGPRPRIPASALGAEATSTEANLASQGPPASDACGDASARPGLFKRRRKLLPFAVFGGSARRTSLGEQPPNLEDASPLESSNEDKDADFANPAEDVEDANPETVEDDGDGPIYLATEASEPNETVLKGSLLTCIDDGQEDPSPCSEDWAIGQSFPQEKSFLDLQQHHGSLLLSSEELEQSNPGFRAVTEGSSVCSLLTEVTPSAAPPTDRAPHSNAAAELRTTGPAGDDCSTSFAGNAAAADTEEESECNRGDCGQDPPRVLEDARPFCEPDHFGGSPYQLVGRSEASEIQGSVLEQLKDTALSSDAEKSAPPEDNECQGEELVEIEESREEKPLVEGEGEQEQEQQEKQDEEACEHDALELNLLKNGLKQLYMAGDGNCQFRSLADQLFGTAEKHLAVRKAIVIHLKQNKAKYSPYIPDSFDDYIQAMAKEGTWGDHVTLQVAADRYRVKIKLITAFQDQFDVEIMPSSSKARVEICLSYYAGRHFNSARAVGKKGVSKGAVFEMGPLWILPSFLA